MRERTVPLTKSHTDTPERVVSVFLAVIQGFMKPVFAKAKMGFVAAAAKARQPLRTVESGAHAIFRKTPAAFEKCGSAPSP